MAAVVPLGGAVDDREHAPDAPTSAPAEIKRLRRFMIPAGECVSVTSFPLVRMLPSLLSIEYDSRVDGGDAMHRAVTTLGADRVHRLLALGQRR
jgi:hypothetical protein